MRRAGGIAWQHVRHEEAAAFAAAAEAALTGELAVCAASCGPGNLHLINGLFDANRSRVPVLAIAAQIPEDEIGSEYFQETHPQNLFRECSVYCELVSEPEQMPRVLEIAMRTALARGGVSVVVIPGGVFFADVPSGAKAVPVRAATAVIRPDDSSLAAAAEVLNSAQRVTILAGAGCAGAHQQLIDLAGAVQAPVVHAFRGKEFIEYDNRFDVGMTGWTPEPTSATRSSRVPRATASPTSTRTMSAPTISGASRSRPGSCGTTPSRTRCCVTCCRRSPRSIFLTRATSRGSKQPENTAAWSWTGSAAGIAASPRVG